MVFRFQLNPVVDKYNIIFCGIGEISDTVFGI